MRHGIGRQPTKHHNAVIKKRTERCECVNDMAGGRRDAGVGVGRTVSEQMNWYTVPGAGRPSTAFLTGHSLHNGTGEPAGRRTASHSSARRRNQRLCHTCEACATTQQSLLGDHPGAAALRNTYVRQKVVLSDDCASASYFQERAGANARRAAVTLRAHQSFGELVDICDRLSPSTHAQQGS